MQAFARAVRAGRERDLEHVRKEVQLGHTFSAAAFERAYAVFRSMYNVRPHRVTCSPDVLRRYCELFEDSAEDATERIVRFEGVPLAAAILPPGTVAFEGEVDPDRMGDW